MVFLIHTHQKVTKSIVLFSFILKAVQNKIVFT